MKQKHEIGIVGIISGSWALFLGMALIMLGNGLQSSLLGVRASMENFGTTITGMMMSGYFLGLIFGCRMVPFMVKRVGHIRIFGALASLASTSILVQAVLVDPLIWWGMRLITGFSYAGLYIVAESWLNEASSNQSRGKLFSFYMLISFSGLGGGQILLNIAPPSGFELFMIVSLLISLAVIPILVSVSQAPPFDSMENISIKMLYSISPLGVVGMLLSGMLIGAIYGMGPVYATDAGMSVKEISFFMGMFILGGFLFQYPLGWLSDHFGRRRIILFCGIAGACISTFAMRMTGSEMFFLLIVATIGGLSLPLYALCVVHTNDYLTPVQMVAASGTLVLLSSIGATIGSPLTAFLMDNYGASSFYGSISAMLIVVTAFTLWRLTRRRGMETVEQGEFVVMTASPLTASLNPDVELNAIEEAIRIEPEKVYSSFEKLATNIENFDDNDAQS